jgi:hypothetical protein
MHFFDIQLDLGSSETRQVREFRSIVFDPSSSMPSTRFEPSPIKDRLKRLEMARPFKRIVCQRKLRMWRHKAGIENEDKTQVSPSLTLSCGGFKACAEDR